MIPGKTGVVSLTLQPNKTSFTPRHTITRKGVTYIKPFDSKLPLRPIEIEFENNRCCIEVHNTSNTPIEFLHVQEMAYFDTRSKGLVQTNNSKHFPIDQYLHDRMTPAILSPTPLAYEKPIHPTEMPHITTCTELSVDDTNKSTLDDKYPWLQYFRLYLLLIYHYTLSVPGYGKKMSQYWFFEHVPLTGLRILINVSFVRKKCI